jgi:hypothetical protein
MRGRDPRISLEGMACPIAVFREKAGQHTAIS